MRKTPSPRFTPSSEKRVEIASPRLRITKVERGHDEIEVWGTLSQGKPVQIRLPTDVVEGHEKDLRQGVWVELKGVIVQQGKDEPIFYSKTPPHRMKGVRIVRYDAADDDIADFDDSFFIDQKCDLFGISHDGMDVDCDDCMFTDRCRELTEQLGADVMDHLAKQGRKPQMIEKVPLWKDTRKPHLLIYGDDGEVIYDKLHRCKVCNAPARIMIMEDGNKTYLWKREKTPYANSVGIKVTDGLTCPYCEVGKFTVKPMKAKV